jgi:hypothetical protein
MYIDDFIWMPNIVDKLIVKHRLIQDEVENVFFTNPKYRFVESGYQSGEDVYSASGQTDSGRYLIVFFIRKPGTQPLFWVQEIWIGKNGDVMGENNDTQATSISKAQTLEEIAEFWDTHSLADYWDETHEVEFEVRDERRRRVTLDPDVYTQLETQARIRGLLPETLVNLWVAERLAAEKPV